MKVTTILTAAILAVAPGLAFASCSGYGHSETASASCASGLSGTMPPGPALTRPAAETTCDPVPAHRIHKTRILPTFFER